ncbi:MAG: RNase adapter RapZ, partial [Acidaminobacteraceae bacterium]
MKLVLITGLSGAGRSQTMKAMEDIGYYCIDNLPPVLIPKFVELCAKNMDEFSKIALVTDIRGGKFFDDLDESISYLRKSGYSFEMVFLEASNGVLIKRFKEARRAHPLLPEGSIEDGIELEREKLRYLRDIADRIIDTSNFNISQFRKELYKVYLDGIETGNMTISVVSFGFKKGLPIEADFVFDVRVLPNPFYIAELKKLTGNEKSVQDYVMKFPESEKYLEKIINMIEFLIPLSIKEGRSQLVIAIGCTG